MSHFGWLIATLLVRLLGPLLVKFIDAQVAQFARANPTYGPSATEGLEKLKQLGLEVVNIVGDYKKPSDTPQETWEDILFDEAVRMLRDRATAEKIVAGKNMIRRTVEESVTTRNEARAKP